MASAGLSEDAPRPSAVKDAGVMLLFLRLLGLVYFFAFLSLLLQIDGLVGSRGILPAQELLSSASRLGVLRYWLLPTLFWLDASDRALEGLCALGTLLSGLLAFGVAPLALTLLLWMLYLSLVSVGGVFMGFQWDNLLLEAGLLAVFVSPWGWKPRPSFRVGWLPRLALRFLLFRLMLASGLVKLLSGDPTWRSLTALTFHYETQPLPTWIGWYFAGLPVFFHKVSTVLMFVVEILCPWLIFGPRVARAVAFFAFLSLQALIALTGNYCFFNLLAVVLCLVLVDDAFLPRWLRGEEPPLKGSWGNRVRSWAAGFTMLVALVPFLSGLRVSVPSPFFVLYAPFEPFRSVNSYGLFAVMTKERPEIVVEGSLDGTTWVPYAFRFKPGDLGRPPAFVAPHQPRLDWQMWFAALGSLDDSPWFSHFLVRLFEASPPVLALLERDPFDGRPPRYIRAEVFRYHFASRDARAREGVWWTRERVGPFTPVFERKPGDVSSSDQQ